MPTGKHVLGEKPFASLPSLRRITGRPQSLDSSFLVPMGNRGDIRYDPALEPLGALGDLGWYNMRATLEYLSPAAELRSVSTRLRRDAQTGAIIAGSGSLTFADGGGRGGSGSPGARRIPLLRSFIYEWYPCPMGSDLHGASLRTGETMSWSCRSFARYLVAKQEMTRYICRPLVFPVGRSCPGVLP